MVLASEEEHPVAENFNLNTTCSIAAITEHMGRYVITINMKCICTYYYTSLWQSAASRIRENSGISTRTAL
jgi:hypothetical protein